MVGDHGSHPAKRIWDRLKAEHAYSGGYTVVKDYVRQARLRHQEVFVPLAHSPGDAQAVKEIAGNGSTVARQT